MKYKIKNLKGGKISAVEKDEVWLNKQPYIVRSKLDACVRVFALGTKNIEQETLAISSCSLNCITNQVLSHYIQQACINNLVQQAVVSALG